MLSFCITNHPAEYKEMLVGHMDMGCHVRLCRPDSIDLVIGIHRVMVQAFGDLFIQIQCDHISFAKARCDAETDPDIAILNIGGRLLALSDSLNNRTC